MEIEVNYFKELFNILNLKLKTLQNNIQLKEKDKINQLLHEMTIILKKYRNMSADNEIQKKVFHDILSKIGNVMIANDINDKHLTEQCFKVLKSIIELFNLIICNEPIEYKSLHNIMSQYSIKIHKKQWFINEDISYILLSAYLLSELMPTEIFMDTDKLIIQDTFCDFTNTNFFKILLGDFSSHYKFHSSYENTQRTLVLTYNK